MDHNNNNMTTTTSDNNNYKLVILGSGAVGKSAITLQFVAGEFSQRYDPTIEDSYTKLFHFDDRAVKVDLLDTAGQDEYSAMRDQYMRYGDGYILVYSITDPSSFYEVKEMYNQLLRSKDMDHGTVPVVIVGNKSDLSSERAVGVDEAKQTVKEYGGLTGFVECSAMNNVNVDKIFETVIRAVEKSRREDFESNIEDELACEEEGENNKKKKKNRRKTAKLTNNNNNNSSNRRIKNKCLIM